MPSFTLRKKQMTPGTVIFIICAVIFGLLLMLALYNTFRRAAARISGDYYFPYMKVIKKAETALADQALLSHSKITLAKAVERLQKENTELATKTALLMTLQEENMKLRELAGITPKGIFRPVFAETLVRDPATWSELFTIDKGSEHGINTGDLVVAPAEIPSTSRFTVAVVGRIKSVAKHTSVVCTVISNECNLSVSLPASQVSGVMEGTGLSAGLFPSVKFLPIKGKYRNGELVTTSAFSEYCPPGLYVGNLASWSDGTVSVEKDHIFAESRLKPLINPDEVRFVAVYTRTRKR